MNSDERSPSYKSTPPTNRKVRNPFDKALIDRLHKPICSPSMCKIYKNKSSGLFRWDIDQACTLVPENIVPCDSQFDPSPDPALERIAEEATERFFSQEMVMPSPIIKPPKTSQLLKTSYDAGIEISKKVTGDVSVQTVLTLPPVLPPELEKLLEKYCTFTFDQQDVTGDYEITANGSQVRKLTFEEHSAHEDSEQTDDENVEERPPSRYEAHTPVVFSPDMINRMVSNNMKRTFDSPIRELTPKYRNKILNVDDFEPCLSPINSQTPNKNVGTPGSFTSVSISPVDTDEVDKKNNLTPSTNDSPCPCASGTNTESCLSDKTPEKSLRRSASMKESPIITRKGYFFERRSLSMSSLNRSRSVQKLDFSMDMSVDGSLHDSMQADCESSPSSKIQSILDERNQRKTDHILIDETPIKGKSISNVLTHNITKIRTPRVVSPLFMSLDGSSENLNLEHKKYDFTNYASEINSLTDFERTKIGECSNSLRRVDSGYNENTFYNNASSYYQSAIKPSELLPKNEKPLKEITNVNWMRVDSGFNENSADSVQFYTQDAKKSLRFSQVQFDDKENTEDFDKFFVGNRTEGMSMSDIFTDDLTFNCNFSSTPSKNRNKVSS